jgi:hypothetical protein
MPGCAVRVRRGMIQGSGGATRRCRGGVLVFMRRRGGHFVLHAVIFGAHGDGLHIHGVRQVLQLTTLRRLGGRGWHCSRMVVARRMIGMRTWRCGCASTPGGGDEVFQRCDIGLIGAIADMDPVIGPVEMSVSHRRLGA